MDRVQRMHWRLLVERMWDPSLAITAAMELPKAGYSAKDRTKLVQQRAAAQAAIKALFPED